MSKSVSATLNVEDLKRVSQELRRYKVKLKEDVHKLIDVMCKEGETYAITQSMNVLTDGDEQISVGVIGYRDGDRGIIIANGDAAFVEFGAGVYFNGAAGSSPHPKGEELGMTIGSYGMGQGADPNGWYWQEGDTWKHSRGTQATMFLYNTARVIAKRVPEFASKIFNEQV